MKQKDFTGFVGQHCETTATGTLLKQLGIDLSEPMLFGIGEGLGFIFWKMKTMDFPFIGGRIKTDMLTENIARNLNLQLNVQETASSKKAWEAVRSLLDKGSAVGLKLDCYHLEYFTNPIHFAGHYVAIYDYDDQFAYLIDTEQQDGKVRTSLESLAKARAEKGPMSSKNLYYTIEKTGKDFDLKKIIPQAIRKNTATYLDAPIANFGAKGILKTSKEIFKWFDTSKNIEAEFTTCAMVMEKAGTGGALFRNMYRDFLAESNELLDLPILAQAHQVFVGIAPLWTEVADLFNKVGTTKDRKYLEDASKILKDLSVREENVITLLSTI